MQVKRLGVLLILAPVLLAACQKQDGDAAAQKSDACMLSVGWDPWEPYQYQASDGSVQGLDIEIVSLLFRDVGCTPQFVQGNWLDLLHRLRDGQVDVLLAATIIPEREKYARFSKPYRQESFALYVRSEDRAALAGQELMALLAAGKRIGFTDGYYYGAKVSELASDERYAANFVAAPVVELNYSRLLEGGIDALLDDPFVASSVIRRKGWSGRISRHPHVIASGQVSLMFSRKNVPDSVVDSFNESLTRREQDGTLARILAKYTN